MKLETKFTKGDWIIHSKSETTITTAKGRTIATTATLQDGTEATYNENQANAKLISRAPKLFNALKDAVEEIDTMILLTPTGKRRNELCEKSIQLTRILYNSIS